MELTDRVRIALRTMAGLDMTPRSYNEMRELTALAHRYMQWHEIGPREAVRLVAYTDPATRSNGSLDLVRFAERIVAALHRRTDENLRRLP